MKNSLSLLSLVYISVKAKKVYIIEIIIIVILVFYYSGDLPFAVDKDWVHMDMVESDKLAWLKDLPPPRADNSQVTYS